MGRPAITYSQAEAAFRDGIGEGLGVRLAEGELTDYEKELAAQLAAEKYGSSDWSHRR
jgi:lipoate-protein ligase A